MTERLLADQAGIERAAAILSAGGLVAFPTDTVYGVGCRWGDDAALERLFDLKRRPPERRVPVLVAGIEQASLVGAEPDDRARRLAVAFWPGPLTVVVPLAVRTGAEPPSIGLRAPDHVAALGLIGLAGPVLTSSANLTGQPEALTAAEVLAAFAGSPLLDAVIDGGATPGGQASTVVDLTTGPAKVLRIGPIGQAELSACIGAVVVTPEGRGDGSR